MANQMQLGQMDSDQVLWTKEALSMGVTINTHKLTLDDRLIAGSVKVLETKLVLGTSDKNR